jgi:hypothetical protein
MYTIDTSSIFHFFQTFWALVKGALWLDPAAFKAIQAPGTDLLAATILFLAGVSEALGQSVVLFANRVKPGRFALSLLLNGLIFIVGAFVWGITIWGIAGIVFHVNQSFVDVMKIVSLAYAPLLFGFLTLLPYMGTFINRLLSVWSFLALMVALIATTSLDLWQALVCSLLGWVFIQLLKYTLGKPFIALERWLKRITAGASLTVGPQNLVKTITENIIDNPKGGNS